MTEPEAREGSEHPTPPSEPPPAAVEAVRAKGDARAELEKRLVRDIVAGERFRTLLLASIATVTLLLIEVQGRAAAERGSALRLQGGFDRLTVEAFLLVVAVFELYVLAWSKNLLVAGGRPQTMRRYLHAFVETSLPTAVIVYYATVDGPVQALLMPSAFVYFVFILLSTLGLEPLLCLFTGAVAAGEYALVALVWGEGDGRVTPASLASQPHHLAKALILLVGGIAAAFVAMRLRRSFTQAIESFGERTRILGVFGQHVSPAVVERLVAHGQAEVKSEQRNVCVMFLDIRDFTAFSEQKSAADVVDYLNVVFDATIDAVVKHNGIVNKFLGDGFMAVFGAPVDDGNASRSAILAAMDIVACVEALVARGAIPPTTVGLGLHTGVAVVGNIGSSARKEYTVIGDVVNLASRIESMNKELGSRVLVSDATYQAAEPNELPALAGAKVHEEVAIRGRKQPIRLWELV
jgi:adenylate cyclase